MFYASFVLNKKGPLARIWLAAHWDKKLTKAHVFETNIDSSVEAILKPKVKLALRTSGHLLLGVVRIYSRKAKYLLADCNEAFVKIKMAFRPGMVDLPEENREAAVAAITLQENFHDFETTLADLEDINVQAQYSVNQSRPEEITMREDLGSITLMGDDGFGDVGFDERGMLPDDGHLDDGLYKTAEMEEERERDREIEEELGSGGVGGTSGSGSSSNHDNHALANNKVDDHGEGSSSSPSNNINMEKEKPMDIDLPPPVVGDDGFGDGGFMASMFGQDFMGTGGLFEDPPVMPSDTVTQETAQAPKSPKPAADEEPAEKQTEEEAEETVNLQTTNAGVSALSSVTGGEQTTLVHNEEEAFALEPLDITTVPGTERKGKRKRKLIVDEQKGIPSESMKLQLSDTTDIVNSLDLAPPTKKLMLWKETGGVDKIFVLPGRSIISKVCKTLYSSNLICKSVSDDYEPGAAQIDLDMAPEVARENERNSTLQDSRLSEMSTIIEEPSNAADISRRRSSRNEKEKEKEKEVSAQSSAEQIQQQPPVEQEQPSIVDTSRRSEMSLLEQPSAVNQSLFDQIPDAIQPVDISATADPNNLVASIDTMLDQGPQSVGAHSMGGPLSVGPPSVGPPSVGPPSVAPFSVGPPSVPPCVTFDMEPELEIEQQMPENAEEDAKRWSKRTQVMQDLFDRGFNEIDTLSFKDMSVNLNRKQAASRFYTLLVLKKHRAIITAQPEPFGDIYISRGPQFGIAC